MNKINKEFFKMTYNNWIESTKQGYEDPCEYQQKERYCEECDIQESKTYFVEETCVCEDCYDNDEPYLTTETKAD